MAGRQPGTRLIDRTPPRVLFAELLAGALERTRVEPSPLATAYLVDLLDERVQARPRPQGADGAQETLAEGLLRACNEAGAARIRRLRAVGDRALFVAGFFGDSLEAGLLGVRYYGDAGRLAYAQLSASLRGVPREPAASGAVPVPQLFEELADRFLDFVEVLTEVSDSTRSHSAQGLATLFTRYLSGGRERDRRRLMRRGLSVPVDGTPRAQ